MALGQLFDYLAIAMFVAFRVNISYTFRIVPRVLFAQRLRSCMQFTPGSDRSRSPRLARGSLAPGSANHLTRMFLNISSAPQASPDSPDPEDCPSRKGHDRWTRPRECTGNREQGLIISVRNTVVDPKGSQRAILGPDSPSKPDPLCNKRTSAGLLDLSKRSNLGSSRIMLPFRSSASQAVSRTHAFQWAPIQRGGN